MGLGRILILMGVVLIVAGIVVSFGEKAGFGRLPGDIVVRRPNFTFYFPIVTSVLLSIVLTLIMMFLNRR
jgi:Protein of unknown function (DUF2905)